MDNRIIVTILGVMATIVIGLGALIWVAMGDDTVPAYDSDFFTNEEGPAVDSGARIEIEKLRGQIEGLSEKLELLERNFNALEARGNETAPMPGQRQGEIVRDGPNQIIDSYSQVVLIANRRNVNEGLRIASPSYLTSVFGQPREVLSDQCQSMTNERLSEQMVLETVGPIRVRMLRPAVESLRRVFNEIEATDSDLYDRINTAGSLCVRHIRGAPSSTSTHAFGLSVDLNIDGRLDTLGDGKTQLGLTILADFFRNEGWYWGAGFSREDSMHFEVGRDLVEEWVEAGLL